LEDKNMTPKVVILILITSGCAIFAQPPVPVRLTVSPGIQSAIPIKTLPNAVCTLQPEGSKDPAQSLRLYADKEGIIRFYARPASRSDVHARLTARCQAGGQVAVIPVELRADTSPIPSMPAPVDLDPRSRSGASSVRPPLEGDPAQVPQEVLRQRGYPPRPDPIKAPGAYATWLKAVSKPSTFIVPQDVRSERVHGPAKLTGKAGPATSYSWSGYAATGSPGAYSLVAGEWFIPSVSGEPGSSAYSLLWIGLDGLNDQYGNPCTDQTCVVVQDGTAQNVLDINFLGVEFQISEYYPFYELFPDGEYEITDYQVNVFDEMFSEVFFDGSIGWFCLEDITASTYTIKSESLADALARAGSSATFVGNTAEWILEGPTEKDSSGNVIPVDLPIYTIAQSYLSLFYAWMGDAYVYANGNWVACGDEPNSQIWMYNGLDLVSTADGCPGGSGNIYFYWQAFH
jgi:hypothetical protein